MPNRNLHQASRLPLLNGEREKAKRHPAVLVCALLIAAYAAMGCASQHSSSSEKPPGNSSGNSSGGIDPQQVQHAIMSFADRYATAMADVYGRTQTNASTLQARITAHRSFSLAGIGAWSNAVNPNPVAGLMDMALMVALTREITAEPWATQVFGSKNVAEILAVLKSQEDDIWSIAATYLTPERIGELRQLAERWRSQNPDQRTAAGVRLADFPQAKTTTGQGTTQLLSSVFGIIRLDPFTGLDPAVREVAESRVLAERMFYYLQHLPIILKWSLQGLYDNILSSPEIQKLFENTTTIAGSTTRFSEDGSRFADATGRFADTIEHFRKQLPEQQAELMAQLNALVAYQRSAALEQATTQVSTQRDVAIRELNSTVTAQQDAMAKNLQAITDHSIDRLYVRLRSLIFIAVGSILVAFLLYRTFAGRPSRAGK